MFFEEKVKAMTAFFNSLLDMRKEINKSLKDEMEVRRKLLKDDFGEESDIEEKLNLSIRGIAKKVDKFQKSVEKNIKLVKPGEKKENEDDGNREQESRRKSS